MGNALSSYYKQSLSGASTTLRSAAREFIGAVSPLVLLYYQNFLDTVNFLKFGEARANDITNYGENILFHYKEKKGNRRFDVFLHEKGGEYTAVYRRSYSKRDASGVNTSYVNAEYFVQFNREDVKKKDLFPKGMEFLGKILTKSDVFKSIIA